MDKNTVIAFILIALVIFAWPFYMEKVAPVQTEDVAPPTPSTGDSPTTAAPAVTPENNSTPAAVVEPQDEEALISSEEKTFKINHPLYTAEISNRGGGSITSFKLKTYQKHDSSAVELINSANSNNLAVSFISTLDGQPVALNNAWNYDTKTTSFDVNDRELRIGFYTFYNGRKITKQLVFIPETYQIDVVMDLSAASDLVSQGTYTVKWPNGLPGTEKNIKDDHTYFKGYVYQAGELTTPRAKDKLKLERLIGQTNWVAIRTKYFAVALISDQVAPYAEMGGIATNGSKVKTSIYSASIAQNSYTPSKIKVYLGPLEYQRVKGLGVELEKIMNFGWSFIRPIAKGVLFLLVKMHNSIPNYGIVLIIFAVLVKILVYPLTKKSHQSTKEMQAIQPLVNELKEKYQNNPQKLNEETMKLYKEHGVNPLGGCLPLLLQMPLLFALFQVFRSTIELRGAEFIWWIKDLSSPDTIFYLPFSIPIYGDQVSVLPIIMGVSMFIQQRMMPTQASGQQKYMSYFMTGFFMLLFNNFPSGLNLYYTLFNVLTILQQKYLTPQHSSLPAAADKPVQKKSGKQRK